MEKPFPKLELVYFKMRAFTEAIQMQLCYGNVPYTYYMAWEYFEKSWPEMKKEIGFGQLPVLIIDIIRALIIGKDIIILRWLPRYFLNMFI